MPPGATCRGPRTSRGRSRSGGALRKGAPQARRPSASLLDLDLGLLLGDEAVGVEERGIREGAACFERPRPDVERHCVFAIVASRWGGDKAVRFRLLDEHPDESGRFFWFKFEARHALIGE